VPCLVRRRAFLQARLTCRMAHSIVHAGGPQGVDVGTLARALFGGFAIVFATAVGFFLVNPQLASFGLLVGVLFACLYVVRLPSGDSHRPSAETEGAMSDNLPLVFDRPEILRYPDPYVPRYQLPPVDPEAVLASMDPRRTAEVIRKRTLAQAHAAITGGPAIEYARQGKGMRASTRFTGGFFSPEGIETSIEPLD
jgi:hypothetical protein